MLKALYDYGIRNGLALPPGFVNKSIRAYLVLSGTGDFLGIEQCDNEVLPCPDIGSLANGPDKSNVLAEKLSVVLFVPTESASDNAKNRFFREALRNGSEWEPMLSLCLHLLETPELLQAAAAEAARLKLKPGDRISFKVSDLPIVRSAAVARWWADYRRQFIKPSEQTLCLITGQPTVPLATVPTVNGLQVVGGHARGDALICFDKNAFCSYGLKQAANAPVSEEAFAAVKAALEDLLAGSPAMYKREKSRSFHPTAPMFAGMKFVHWYDQPITPEEDPIPPEFGGFDWAEDEDDTPTPETAQQEESYQAAAANAAADTLIRSIQTGTSTAPLTCRYYIMLLSGANGRVMVRRYEHGSYETLQKNLALWNSDLALCSQTGTGTLRPRKLAARLICLLSRQKNDRKPLERMKKELAGLTPSIVTAVINGTPLPDAVASRALATIRSEMLDPDENVAYPFMPNGTCCQWLKVWLLRKHRIRNEEVPLMTCYDPELSNAAYHCGAMVAIYADLQRAAMPDVNAGIVQRFYASASRSPALVLGQLSSRATYYLAKVDSWKANIYKERLQETAVILRTKCSNQLPTTLNLEEQSYFALGYYQMSAQMKADRREAIANKKTRQNTEQEDV